MPERVARLLNRRAVAREWQVPPCAVDEAPYGEVQLALQLMEIESERPGAAPSGSPPGDDD